MRFNIDRARRAFQRGRRGLWQQLEAGAGTGPGLVAVSLMAFRMGLVLLTFVVLDRVLSRLGRLPEAAYSEPTLVPQLLGSISDLPRLLGLVVLALVLLGGWVGRSRWSDAADGKRLRTWALIVAGILVWADATYDYNLYFNQAHYADRLLLIASLALVWWRPINVLVTVLLATAIVQQFAYPLGGYSWTDQHLLLRSLTLLGAAQLVGVFSTKGGTRDWLTLQACLIASPYWASGLAKLQMGWLFDDGVYLMLPATYANGWLAFLEAETIGRMTRALALFNGPIKLFTLAVECGAVLFLLRRNVSRGLLTGWILLHVGIFTVSGICFWMWILIELALLGLFFSDPRETAGFFRWSRFAVSVLLIAVAGLWARPTALAWYDASATYTYRVFATSQTGTRRQLSATFFAPYDYQFTMGGFHYLVDTPRLPIFWGATRSRTVAEQLRRSTRGEEVFAIETREGTIRHDAGRAARLDQFLVGVLAHHNSRKSRRTWLSLLRAPPLFWTFSRDAEGPPGESVVRIEVVEVLSFFDGESYLEIREQVVRDLEIPRMEGIRRPPEMELTRLTGPAVAGGRAVRAAGPDGTERERPGSAP